MLADFDLLGELDLVLDSSLPPVSDADAAEEICRLQQSPPAAAPQRPTIRLQSLSLTAAKVSAAHSIRRGSGAGGGAAPNGSPPLLSRDVNGSGGDRRNYLGRGAADLSSSACSDAGDVGGHALPRMQQEAVRRGAFKAPRLQPPSERPASRLQAVGKPHVQQSSGVPGSGVQQDDAGRQAADTGPHRRASNGSNDAQAAADEMAAAPAVARGSAAAQPAQITPPPPPQPRRQSGILAPGPHLQTPLHAWAAANSNS